MAKVVDRELMGKSKQKHWISYINQRISRNKNFICFISGPTGGGKSWSSLSIGEQLDSDFNIDRVVFSGMELMTLINSGLLKRGSVIVFEEAGIEMNNKNWASVTNKMINYLMQTFRHRGFILIMNSPYMDFVDASTRKLFHAEFQTCGIDLKKQTVRLKPHLIQYNARYRKFYYKRLKVITKEGNVPVDFWNVEKPSKDLLREYEVKKREFTDNLNKNILAELEQVELNKRGMKVLTPIQRETLDCLRSGMTIREVAEARGKAYSTVCLTLRELRKKGCVFEEKKREDGQVEYSLVND